MSISIASANWTCPTCTFSNNPAGETVCSVCSASCPSPSTPLVSAQPQPTYQTIPLSQSSSSAPVLAPSFASSSSSSSSSTLPITTSTFIPSTSSTSSAAPTPTTLPATPSSFGPSPSFTQHKDTKAVAEERAACRKAFDTFDTDESGYIDATEFGLLMNFPALRGPGTKPATTEEIQAALAAIDSSKDGKISFDEFYDWWSKPASTGRGSVTHRPAGPHLERVKSSLKKDHWIGSIAQFGMKETFFCNICFSWELTSVGHNLKNCGHPFCKECLTGYFHSKITDGQVYLKCFHKAEEGKETKVGDSLGLCNASIDPKDILETVDEVDKEKFKKFRSNLENPHQRQCEKCKHYQTGDPEKPVMACGQCGHVYCYSHGDGHGADKTCAQFEREHRQEFLKSQALISKISKPCPKCKAPIQKNNGCNHMKCMHCQCSFCWLCVSVIDDVPYPDHFKTTGLGVSACAGQQFERQSCLQQILLALVGLWMLIVILPLSLVLTLTLMIACFCCVVCGERTDPNFFIHIKNVFVGLNQFFISLCCQCVACIVTLAFCPIWCPIATCYFALNPVADIDVQAEQEVEEEWRRQEASEEAAPPAGTSASSAVTSSSSALPSAVQPEALKGEGDAYHRL